MTSTTQTALTRAGRFLCSRQDREGAICDQDYRIFDVWETVNAIKALALLQQRGIFLAPAGTLDRALAYVMESEVDSGLIIYNARREYGDRHCIESSAEYLLALRAANRLDHAQARLRRLKDLQAADGRWKLDYPDIPLRLHYFPSVTAFALMALSELGETPHHLPEAIQQLTDSQNEQGHWGAEWEYYGTPFYALSPITLALATHGQHRALDRARSYLTSSQRPDGSWHYAWEDLSNIPSAELQTALALRSCHHCGLGSDSPTTRKGHAWLVSQQRDDGSFFGGHFPIPAHYGKTKVETVYATTQAILALLAAV